ncbi:hypothetical protein AX16_004910 [Volvariella volvacea WC 439]|nr:hypothetical protein AX16_004910 [Volvariella volvacea WC 439]
MPLDSLINSSWRVNSVVEELTAPSCLTPKLRPTSMQKIGVDEIIEAQRPFAIKRGVSFSGFIQSAGVVDLLVPEPSDSVDAILAQAADAEISTSEMVDFLASHSVAAQDHIDETIPGTTFNLISSVFNANFFLEVLLKGDAIPGNGINEGEVMSPLQGKFRLQSDFELSQNPCTACEWQSFITDQDRMVAKFTVAMTKMATIGHIPALLTDCSEVIPIPAAAKAQVANLPARKTLNDVQAACKTIPFPTVTADAGPETTVARV